MSWRLVQKGRAPVVIAYLVGPEQDRKLRDALPGIAIVATSDAPPTPHIRELDAARAFVGLPGAAMVLVGYSAGCQAVRAHLRQAAAPVVGVVTIDGTHASLPPLAWQIDVWRDLAERARRGDVLWVATCTQQVYTERLDPRPPPRGDGHEPFMATLHVLEAALETPLLPGTSVHEGGLHVLSYDSQRMDGEAHKRQLGDVLPDMLTHYVGPHISPIDDPTTEPGSSALPWQDKALPLGERAVLLSLHEMQSGVREEPPGSNTSPRIREYLAPAHRDGRLLNLEAAEWCAAAACWTALTCAGGFDGDESEVIPHPYVVSGIEIETAAKRNGSFWPSGSGYNPRRGDLALYRRGSQAWMRHVVRVETPPEDGMHWRSIGGNEGNAWGLTPRRMDDANLIGFVEYPVVGAVSARDA